MNEHRDLERSVESPDRPEVAAEEPPVGDSLSSSTVYVPEIGFDPKSGAYYDAGHYVSASPEQERQLRQLVQQLQQQWGPSPPEQRSASPSAYEGYPPGYDPDDPRWKEWLAGEVVREQLWRKGATESHALWLDFERFLARTFKRTLRNAATTYSLITVMSLMLFLMGVGLCLFAAWYATQPGAEKIYTAIFGGMGAASFVSLVLLTPFDKAQSALSNLMQAELCFMTTFQQIRMWRDYPMSETGVVDPARMQVATDNIERLTRRAMILLERYLEPVVKKEDKDKAATRPQTS